MRTSEKLAIAWPALLKLTEKGRVEIYYRGVNTLGSPLYELKGLNGASSGLLTESELLDRLMREAKEGKE